MARHAIEEGALSAHKTSTLEQKRPKTQQWRKTLELIMGEEGDETVDASPVPELMVFHSMMRQLHQSEMRSAVRHHEDDSSAASSFMSKEAQEPSPTAETSFVKRSLTDQSGQNHTVANDGKCTENSEVEGSKECHRSASMVDEETSQKPTLTEKKPVESFLKSSSSWVMISWKDRTTKSRILIATAGVLVVGTSLGYWLSRPPGRRRRR